MKEDILRLTNIAYKILEFFPESDPLKQRAKDKALAIMSNPDQDDIDILLGYFWIGKCQGWISSINYLIIVNEYEKAKKEISGFLSEDKKPLQVEKSKAEPETKKNKNLGGRKSQIVSFLEKNEKAQVMDLQKVLPNITKRTIRRDLDELLKIGKIARFGEFNQVFYRIKG